MNLQTTDQARAWKAGFLFIWLAAHRHKLFNCSMFLFEWKTSV